MLMGFNTWDKAEGLFAYWSIILLFGFDYFSMMNFFK